MPETKPTAKTEILRVLEAARSPLAVHEMSRIIPNYNQNNLASRLPELALAGLVIGTKRPGKPFKEWSLVRATAGQAELPLERPTPPDCFYDVITGAQPY